MFHIIALVATQVSGKVNNKKKNNGKDFFPPALSNAAPTPAIFSDVPPPTTMAGAAQEPAGVSTPAPKKRELETATPDYTAVAKKARRRSKGEMPPTDDQFDSIRLDDKLTVLELVELISTRLKLVFLFSPIVSPFFLFHQMVLVELEPAHGLSKQVLKHAWENQTVGALCLQLHVLHVCVVAISISFYVDLGSRVTKLWAAKLHQLSQFVRTNVVREFPELTMKPKTGVQSWALLNDKNLKRQVFCFTVQ